MRRKYSGKGLRDFIDEYNLYYDIEGRPITMQEWCIRLENIYYKRVNLTHLKDGRSIYTSWMGLNHNYGEGEPLIFETMMFPKGDFIDLDCERYHTLEEARAGHLEMVRKYARPL